MEPKIFVCTVHIGTEPFWLVTQPKFLRAHIPNAILVAAIEDHVDLASRYDHVAVLAGAHREKLDELGRRVVERMATSENDLIIFLDGDAFPIRDPMPRISELLREFPLAAVCREENGEDYPHPSFCATTVGFWRSIGGTWELSSRPESEINELGGGKLRDTLEEQGIQWRRLLRSNVFNPHPLMFGLYDDIIYHHGAGFRKPVTAVDREALSSHLPPELSLAYEHLLPLIADRNQAMSTTFKWMIEYVHDFHRILQGSSP